MNSDHSPKTGHVFAHIIEKAWLSEIFGHHNPFSIMNYGEKSQLTREDVDDLKKLYEFARDGQLSHINGTPVVLVTPMIVLAVSMNYGREGLRPDCLLPESCDS